MVTAPVPLEAEEGKALVAYLRLRGHKFTHIPNETGRSPEARRRAIRMKQQGTSSGFPDYIVIVPTKTRGDRTVIIELKRQRGSKTSPEQLQWIAAFLQAGIDARVCKGAADAIDFIKEVQQS